jgi:hypothetical protein
MAARSDEIAQCAQAYSVPARCEHVGARRFDEHPDA